MTAFLFQNLKLIMLFLLIGSVIGLANIRSETRILRIAAVRLPMFVRLRADAH
jgi:hypothetical protein